MASSGTKQGLGIVRVNRLERGRGVPWPQAMRNPFRYFNNSPEVMRLAVMLYIRYPLSLRRVEDILFERGIDICHETVRYGWDRFAPVFAGEIRRRHVDRRDGSNWRWHLDEVFVRINGEMHYLWRALDHEGEVLEVVATRRRDRRAALTFLKRTMKRYGGPQVIVTDRLRSYGAAMNVMGVEESSDLRSVAQPSGRKLTPTVPPTSRRNGQVQGHQDPAEVCCRPRLHPQSFQPGTSSLQSRELQTQSLRRFGRVASTCSLRVLDFWLYWSDQVSLAVPIDGLAGRLY